MGWAIVTLLLVLSACAAVITYFAVRMLRAAQITLTHTEGTLERILAELRATNEESQRLIGLSSEVLKDMQGKLRAVDSWFIAAQSTGEAADRMSRSVQTLSRAVEDTVLEAKRSVHSSQSTVNELMELTTAGIHLWHRWQASRQTKTELTAPPVSKHFKEE